jgi:sugar lactone lactonase YvrE
MKDKGFIVITMLLLLLLLSVMAFMVNSRSGLQARMAGNQTDSMQTYYSQLAVIEQSNWKLMQDPCWRVPSGENYTYNGKTYTRKVMSPDTVTYPALVPYKDAVIVSVTAPYASRPVNQSLRYTIDTASPLAIGTTKDVHVTSAGDIYFTDIDTHSVWRINAGTGAMTRVAGTGTSGYSGDGGPATSAQLNQPMGVLVDSAGNVYIGEYGGHRIRKVGIMGTIATIAGTGAAGWTGDGGPAVNATLNCPQGMAFDQQGNLLIADSANHVVRKITTSTGIITTIAGIGLQGFTGNNGPATSARLKFDADVAVDSAGNIYVADSGNNVVRKIDAATQIITAFAGTGAASFSGDGGPATAATLNNIQGINLDAAGNVYIADQNNCRIRKVTASNNKISTIAGDGTCAYAGDGGLATSAHINYPKGVAVKSTGEVIISDAFNKCIRQVAGNTISTLPGTAPGQGLNTPEGFTPYYDTTQNKLFLFIAETANNRIRQLDTVSQTVVTVAGTGTAGYSGDLWWATSAKLNGPQGVSLDSSGNIYIADTGNNRIRWVWAATGIITTVAGNGTAGNGGDGGSATAAKINLPQGVFVDTAGNIYIADTGNNRIRKVTASTGIITTVAGSASSGGYSGDGGPATSAKLQSPQGVFVDTAGNMYIADSSNNRIRKVTASTGIITTVAGNGTAGFTGDGGQATAAKINLPQGVSVDAAGNIYIADTGNHVIRAVNVHDGTISTMVGIGSSSGFNGDLIPAVTALLNAPSGVVVSGAGGGGRIYVSDTSNNRIRKLSLNVVKELY